MGVPDLKAIPTGVLLALLGCLLSAAAGGSIGYGIGFRYAEALGGDALAKVQQKHAESALRVETESRLQLQQQTIRANETEALLLTQYDRNEAATKPLQERIPNVTTNYRPTLTAAPVAIPRTVFTAGWLRDYNLALGVSAPSENSTATSADQAAWPAPGSDAELLESGVTPADILAHAQAYGRWARNNADQLNALLDLQTKD